MDEKILLLKGKAGLGNRLLVVLSAIPYCEMTKRRLVIDWRDRAYARAGTNAFPQLFESPHAGDPAAYESSTSVYPEAWRGRMTRSVDEILGEDFPNEEEIDTNRSAMTKYTVDMRRLDRDADVLVRWAWTHEIGDLRPRFGRAQRRFKWRSDNTILRKIVQEHLRPSAELRRRVDELAKKHISGPTIGLHVRYSDRKNPFEHYRLFVDKFFRQNRDAGVFLATDNAEVEAYFDKLYPGRVGTAPKWMPPPGVPIHRTRAEDRDPAEGALEALTDMYLLGRCQRLVVNTTSTFGHCAVLLSKAKGKDIINTMPFTFREQAKRIYLAIRARAVV